MANSGRMRGNSAEETALLQELLAAGTRGEQQRLWAAFVGRYERLIVSCVVKAMRRYGATFSRDDIDDLTNDVWLALLRDDLRKLRQYDAERGFRIASFIGLVATNVAIDHLRTRQAESAPLDEGLEDIVSLRMEAPRDALEFREQANLAQEALNRLSHDERDFVVWCFRDEQPPEELARHLGVTTNTVYSRKFKVREKLQKIVAELAA
jgi:RNA polymerase sigma-70 factor (ECF subfamily)